MRHGKQAGDVRTSISCFQQQRGGIFDVKYRSELVKYCSYRLKQYDTMSSNVLYSTWTSFYFDFILIHLEQYRICASPLFDCSFTCPGNQYDSYGADDRLDMYMLSSLAVSSYTSGWVPSSLSFSSPSSSCLLTSTSASVNATSTRTKSVLHKLITFKTQFQHPPPQKKALFWFDKTFHDMTTSKLSQHFSILVIDRT
jgi:hypothetical protein